MASTSPFPKPSEIIAEARKLAQVEKEHTKGYGNAGKKPKDLRLAKHSEAWGVPAPTRLPKFFSEVKPTPHSPYSKGNKHQQQNPVDREDGRGMQFKKSKRSLSNDFEASAAQPVKNTKASIHKDYGLQGKQAAGKKKTPGGTSSKKSTPRRGSNSAQPAPHVPKPPPKKHVAKPPPSNQKPTKGRPVPNGGSAPPPSEEDETKKDEEGHHLSSTQEHESESVDKDAANRSTTPSEHASSPPRSSLSRSPSPSADDTPRSSKNGDDAAESHHNEDTRHEENNVEDNDEHEEKKNLDVDEEQPVASNSVEDGKEDEQQVENVESLAVDTSEQDINKTDANRDDDEEDSMSSDDDDLTVPLTPHSSSMAMAHGDRRKARQYIKEHGNQLTPQQVRRKMKKVDAHHPGELEQLWHAIAGRCSMDVLRQWLDVEEGSITEHEEILKPMEVRGVAVMSDAAGLSKLSKIRPLLEVLRLVHEPKEMVYVNGVRNGGVVAGPWIADNTAMFYAVEEGGRSSAASTGDDKTPILDVVTLMYRLQRCCLADLTVKIGMGVHFSTFYSFGEGRLMGHDADMVEVLAEDNTKGGEIALTQATVKSLLKETLALRIGTDEEMLASQKRGGRNADGTPIDSEDDLQKAEADIISVGSPFFSLQKRAPDEETPDNVTYRVVPATAEDGSEAEVDVEELATGAETPLIRNILDASTSNRHADDLYPSGFSDDFSKLLRTHSIDTIMEHEGEVAGSLCPGHYMLIKIRNVTMDLLLDAMSLSLLACHLIRKCTRRAQQKLAMPSEEKEHHQSDDEETPQSVSFASSSLELIKCNGNIAIARADTIEEAVDFCRRVSIRLNRAGFGFSCGVWYGDAYVFDLPHGDRDCTGLPINLASKLAEDFGQEGTFVSSDIALAEGVEATDVSVTISGVEIKAKKLL